MLVVRKLILLLTSPNNRAGQSCPPLSDQVTGTIDREQKYSQKEENESFSALVYTLLYKMPSNSKGKNFV